MQNLVTHCKMSRWPVALNLYYIYYHSTAIAQTNANVVTVMRAGLDYARWSKCQQLHLLSSLTVTNLVPKYGVSAAILFVLTCN